MKTKDNFVKIRDMVAATGKESPLSARAVNILAASKTQPAHIIEEAIAAGCMIFGENRVQEAQEKWATGGLRAKYPHIKLHLIGALQTNKVRQALQLFDVIESVDRVKLAEVLSAELRVLRENKTQHSALLTHNFFIQVNTGEEPQKAGIFPEQADEFIKYCLHDLKLPVVGLMCVPPAEQPPAPHFALLRAIAIRNGLSELSMGMSHDFETAIRMGATCVRVGSGIFGERE